MSSYTLIIGGVKGDHEDLWPITGILRLLHQAIIDNPIAIKPKATKKSIKLFTNDGSNNYKALEYLSSFSLSQGGYIEIGKKKATWMFHDELNDASSSLETLEHIFDYFKEQRDCGVVSVEECVADETFEEDNDGRCPPVEIYNIDTYDFRHEDDQQPVRKITFLNKNYKEAFSQKENPLFPMRINILEKNKTEPLLGYHVYGNPEALTDWLSSDPSSQARQSVAMTLLKGMDLDGINAVLNESPGKKAAETALFPLQQFLNHYQPTELDLQTVVYGLRKAKYTLEKTWPEACELFSKLDKTYSKKILDTPTALLMQQREQRLHRLAEADTPLKKMRKII